MLSSYDNCKRIWTTQDQIIYIYIYIYIYIIVMVNSPGYPKYGTTRHPIKWFIIKEVTAGIARERPVSQMRAPLAACRELAVDEDTLLKKPLYVFEY